MRTFPVQGGIFILYERQPGRCFTSFSNRYILSPEEKIIVDYYKKIPSNQAFEFDKTLDGSRYIINMEDKIYLFLNIKKLEEGLEAELHSNQLRGYAFGSAFFSVGLIYRPRLVWLNLRTQTKTVVPIAHELVGDQGVFTPLKVRNIKLEPSHYKLYFETEVIKNVNRHNIASHLLNLKKNIKPVRVLLGEDIKISL